MRAQSWGNDKVTKKQMYCRLLNRIIPVASAGPWQLVNNKKCLACWYKSEQKRPAEFLQNMLCIPMGICTSIALIWIFLCLFCKTEKLFWRTFGFSNSCLGYSSLQWKSDTLWLQTSNSPLFSLTTKRSSMYNFWTEYLNTKKLRILWQTTSCGFLITVIIFVSCYSLDVWKLPFRLEEKR